MAVATPTTTRPTVPLPGVAANEIPETLRYRLKNRLLGPPLVTEQLASERLGKPTALGVLSPDCISSSAYGTEQMLTQLVPFVGLAAFTLVVPITLAILGVLFFVTLSYLEVIALYTKAGGSYVVARDNFGPRIAQIAAVALLIDYTVTVAVQTAAGTNALTSAVPSLVHYQVPITVAVVICCSTAICGACARRARFLPCRRIFSSPPSACSSWSAWCGPPPPACQRPTSMRLELSPWGPTPGAGS